MAQNKTKPTDVVESEWEYRPSAERSAGEACTGNLMFWVIISDVLLGVCVSG